MNVIVAPFTVSVFENFEYEVEIAMRTFPDAVEACVKKDGELVSIEDEKTWTWLLTILDAPTNDTGRCTS